jgi:hypothetical protein
MLQNPDLWAYVLKGRLINPIVAEGLRIAQRSHAAYSDREIYIYYAVGNQYLWKIFLITL